MGFTTTCPSASIYKPIHNLEILSQAKFLKYVDSMTDLYYIKELGQRHDHNKSLCS